LVGNASDNTLTGLVGGDTLDGGLGADTMTGGADNDIYFVDNIGDKVIEAVGQGTDTVNSSINFNLGGIQVENVVLTGTATSAIGNSLNNTLLGNDSANTLSGLGGADILDGKLGADTLTGGAGADTFAFSTAIGPDNIDAILDFAVVDDTIQLASSVFTGLVAGGLAAGAFAIGNAALDGTDRIIYNAATGALLFDDDGTGVHAAVQFATLSSGLALTNADFLVV
jgi:serralysin